MPTIHFSLETTLAPSVVMAGLTDFGPSRSEIWPNVDREHFKLHGEGPGWAEVTEGSSVAGGVWLRADVAHRAGLRLKITGAASIDTTLAVDVTTAW